MERVRVPVDAFREGRLPEVCARTGTPADWLVRLRAYRTPRWTWSLLLLGVPALLVARLLATQEVEGFVPLSDRALSRLERLSLILRIELILSILILAVSFYGKWLVLARLGMVALAIVMTTSVLGQRFCSVGAEVDRGGRWVVLTRVHPAFREALDQSHREPGR
jgi:hypothetical protein